MNDTKQTKSVDSSKCFNCSINLIILIGGTRCKLCSKDYLDYKFCDTCIQSSTIIAGQSFKNLCANCIEILLNSYTEEKKKKEEEDKTMSLPDQRTVSFIQFEKLASDACVILEKNPLDDFFIQKKISGGTFGQVYKVVEKGTNLSFAAKIMK